VLKSFYFAPVHTLSPINKRRKLVSTIVAIKLNGFVGESADVEGIAFYSEEESLTERLQYSDYVRQNVC